MNKGLFVSQEFSENFLTLILSKQRAYSVFHESAIATCSFVFHGRRQIHLNLN